MSPSNRQSVCDETASMVSELRETVSQLTRTWDSIDMTEEDRLQRLDTFYEHVRSMLKQLVTEEEEMAATVQTKAEEYTLKLQTVCRLLQIEIYTPSAPRLYQALAEMRAKHAELEQVADQRRQRVSELHERDTQLSHRLGTAPRAKWAPLAVPTEADLVDYENHVQGLEKLLDSREQQWLDGCDHVRQIYGQLRVSPLGDFERLVLNGGETDSMVLAERTMRQLSALVDQASEQLAMHIAALAQKVNDATHELNEAYDQCQVPQNQRSCFDVPKGREMDTDFVCALVANIESESNKWRQIYEQRKGVYDAVANWQSLWLRKCDLDERIETDPELRSNRGGRLDKALKEQKVMELRELPAARESVKHAMDVYVSQVPLSDPVKEVLYRVCEVPQHCNGTSEGIDFNGFVDAVEFIDDLVRQKKEDILLQKKLRAEERRQRSQHGTPQKIGAGAKSLASSTTTLQGRANSAGKVLPAPIVGGMATSVGKVAPVQNGVGKMAQNGVAGGKNLAGGVENNNCASISQRAQEQHSQKSSAVSKAIPGSNLPRFRPQDD